MGDREPVGRRPDEGNGDPEATTQADTEWPVAPQYQITPDPVSEQEVADEGGELTVEAPRRAQARGVPAAAVAAAVLALLLLVGAAAAWLVVRPDNSTAGSTGRGSRSQTPTTTPESAGVVATSGSTSTTTDSSTTTESIDVPDVVGLQVGEARQKLRDAKLTPRTRLRSSSREAGTVLDQQPNAGAAVDSESVVVLDVAKRPAAALATVTVPRLVGTTAASAKNRLSSLGLHWSVATRASDRERGIVLAQSPSAGAKLEKERTVTLTVSSGPARISVPDVTGLDADSARAQLVNAGFVVTVVDQPTSDPDQDGVVVDQDPPGGADEAKGSTVTITIARLS